MRAQGKSRDRKVLEALEKWRYMRADQIASLYFLTVKDEKQRMKTVSTRGKVLAKAGHLHRMRFPGEAYIYSIEGNKYSHKMNHYLSILDVWLMLLGKRPSGAQITAYPEQSFEQVIPDLYIEYVNEFRKEKKQYFVEVELDSSGDVEKKLLNYSMMLYNRKSQGIVGDSVTILYKHKRVEQAQIPAVFGQLEIPCRLMPLGELERVWKW